MLCWWWRRTQQWYRSADGRYKGGKYEEFELRKMADKKEQKNMSLYISLRSYHTVTPYVSQCKHGTNFSYNVNIGFDFL